MSDRAWWCTVPGPRSPRSCSTPPTICAGPAASPQARRPGPLVEGATVERTARFLGRRFTYGYVVTRHEKNRLVELEVDRPFPMLIRYELADHPDGTLVSIHATGTPGRFFGWATPLLARQVHRNIAADLGRLRGCLEAG